MQREDAIVIKSLSEASGQHPLLPCLDVSLVNVSTGQLTMPRSGQRSLRASGSLRLHLTASTKPYPNRQISFLARERKSFTDLPKGRGVLALS